MRTGTRLARTTAKLLIAFFALSGVLGAHPRHGHSHRSHSQSTNTLLSSSAAYELDSDFKADRVTLHSNGFDKTISIAFGNSRNKILGFTTRSDDGGKLVAGDIDRDGDVDLIWVGGSDPNNAVVLINQGEGSFAEVSDNSSYSSELDELFNAGGSPGKRSLKRHRKTSSLTSSFFSDLSFGLKTSFDTPRTENRLVATVERVADRAAIFTPVRKRGPPSILR